MGVRAKRWQLWLITMFILTGIIGVFQLFEGPKSVGAVTVAGGVATPLVGLPERSLEATQLPAWQPSVEASQSSETRTTTIAAKPVMASSTQVAVTPTTHAVQVTSQPTVTKATVTTQATTQAPSTKAPVISAKSVSATATVSSPKPAVTTTQPAVTTTQPKATTTAPKPAMTTAKATTTAPKPSQSVLKPSTTATSTWPTTQPSCYRFFFFRICH